MVDYEHSVKQTIDGYAATMLTNVSRQILSLPNGLTFHQYLVSTLSLNSNGNECHAWLIGNKQLDSRCT